MTEYPSVPCVLKTPRQSSLLHGVTNLHVVANRGVTATFESLPNRSIALDGYVQGPQLDPRRERYSFDHHGSCVRLATSATCRQVLEAVLLGFDPTGFTVFVNDVDADVALSLLLLSNPHLATDPWVLRLVDAVATMDAHGPAFPVQEVALGVGFARIVAAAWTAASSPSLCEQIEASLTAASAFVENHGPCDAAPSQPLDIEACITHRGREWVMARSPQSIFAVAYRAGYRRVIAYQPGELGSWSYTVARQSDFVSDFPVESPGGQPSIMAALRARETGWGGGSTIGGAPRMPDGSRSRLSPDTVFEIVECALRNLTKDGTLRLQWTRLAGRSVDIKM